MKKFVETAGFIVCVQGVAGLLYEWTGWFRLWTVVARLRFLDDYGLFVNIVLVVTGGALMIAADSIKDVTSARRRPHAVPASTSTAPSAPAAPRRSPPIAMPTAAAQSGSVPSSRLTRDGEVRRTDHICTKNANSVQNTERKSSPAHSRGAEVRGHRPGRGARAGSGGQHGEDGDRAAELDGGQGERVGVLDGLDAGHRQDVDRAGEGREQHQEVARRGAGEAGALGQQDHAGDGEARRRRGRRPAA